MRSKARKHSRRHPHSVKRTFHNRPSRNIQTRRCVGSAPSNVWRDWQSRRIRFPKRPHLKLSELDRIPHVNENNKPIDIKHEREEQYVSHDYIEPNCVVLELGARYGVVSSVINNKLEHPTHHVCVEPDQSVLECLRTNRRTHKSHFHIVSGVVSKKPVGLLQNGYASRLVPVDSKAPALPTHTVEALQKKYKLRFDTLVADCEGCLCAFADENPEFVFRQLRTIMFEADLPKRCDYASLRRRLHAAGFRVVVDGFVSFWKKTGRR